MATQQVRPRPPGPIVCPPVTTLAGRKLRQWRRERNHSGQEAAMLLGMSLPTLWRIETEGRVPRMKLAERLVERGICEWSDFSQRAALEPEGDEG